MHAARRVHLTVVSLLRFRLGFEFPPTGGIIPYSRFETVKLLRYITASDYALMGVELVFAVFTLYYIIEEFIEIKENKLEYFKTFWNVIDLFVITVTLLCPVSNAPLIYLYTFYPDIRGSVGVQLVLLPPCVDVAEGIAGGARNVRGLHVLGHVVQDVAGRRRNGRLLCLAQSLQVHFVQQDHDAVVGDNHKGTT